MKAHPLLSRVLVLVGVGLGLSALVAAQDCNCPKFEIVSELEMVKAGEIVEFEIVSDDSATHDAKFSWTTSAGKIISGHGTRRIVVQTAVEMLTAPQPTPTPLPPAGRDGYLIDIFVGRKPRLITVTATPTREACSCDPTSASVQIGRENREKNKPAEVTDLKLSETKLFPPCKPDYRPGEGVTVSDSMVIDVSVTAHDPENDVLLFNYTVSAGKIVGSGANVKWDLSGVAPGTYTITAGVDDGCGICGNTETKTVTVIDHCEASCGDCQCPTVELVGPDEDIISPGENTFVANLTSGTYDPTYEWIVEGGDIVSGQGTPVLKAEFDAKALRSPKAVTVRIGGMPQTCFCPVEQVIEYVDGRRKP